MSGFRKQCELIVQGICRNLLTYAEHLTNATSEEMPVLPVLFTSALSIEKESESSSTFSFFFFGLNSQVSLTFLARVHGVVPSLGLLCLFLKQQISNFGHTLSAMEKLQQDAGQLEKLEVSEQKAYAASHYRGSVDDLASEERHAFASLAIDTLQREKSVESSNLICTIFFSSS